MALSTKERQNVVYFTGFEVEHTVCYGMRTLFVVGTPPLREILKRASLDPEIKQIYFGTSQSFNPDTYEDWKIWDDRISSCLEKNFWVTLDFDVSYCESIHEKSWCNHNRFVPMISVKIPYIKMFNYNSTLKIDDITWGATNSGVWTHHLVNLLQKENYTHWDQYTQDTDIE